MLSLRIPSVSLLFLLILFLTGGCGSKTSKTTEWQVSGKVTEGGPIRAQVFLEKERFSILERQHLKLEVIAPANVILTYPGFEERFEDFRLISWRPMEEEKLDGGRKKETKYLAFELFESGEQALPPFQISFEDLDLDRKGSLTTPSLTYHIDPIDDPSLVNAPLDPPLGLELPPSNIPWKFLSWAGAILLSLLFLSFLWRRWKGRDITQEAVVIPAHQWAFEALRKLATEREEGGIENETFLFRLNSILRGYLERRYRLPVVEQTTEEFLNGLEQHPVLGEHAKVLQRFLEYGDLVKFATQHVDMEDAQKGFDFLKAFIESTQEVDS